MLNSSMVFYLLYNMNLDFEIFNGKTYKDLLHDIVETTNNKRDQIDIIIADLRDKIKTISDAVIMAPIIQSYLDISVKNDDALTKLAAVVQRLITASSDPDASGNYGLTDSEKEQLLKEIKNVELDVNVPLEIKK